MALSTRCLFSSFLALCLTRTHSWVPSYPSKYSTALYSDLLYQEQEKMLVRRGQMEAVLMANTHTPLQTNTVKGAGSGGGFGSKGGSQKQLLKAQGKAHAVALRRDGVVRMDSVLPTDQAAAVREFAYALRVESEQAVQRHEIQPIERFADVLLKENRCDLTMPFGSTIAADALYSLLVDSPVGATVKALLGKDAVLYELSCLMSDPGSNRQVVHPDTPCTADDELPALYTCFVALQDIDIDMGPTTWLPGTHTTEAHGLFQDESVGSGGDGESPKDQLLRTRPAVLGTLPAGSCGMFDSRLLHCGGANTSAGSRALFYFSFKNPKIGNPGNPGSIRRDYIGQFTLEQLEKELTAYKKGKPSPRILPDDE